MSPNELKSLIKVCSRYGVDEISVDSVKIRFKGNVPTTIEYSPSQKASIALAASANQSAQLDFTDYNLQLTDPLAFEKKLLEESDFNEDT